MAALEMLENHLTALKQFPQFYKKLTLDYPTTKTILDGGYICPLQEKDSQGRQVMFYNGRKIDVTNLTSVDIIRFTNAMYSHLLADEQSQVAGFVVIVDGRNVNMQLLSLFSIIDLNNWLSMVQKGVDFIMSLTLFFKYSFYQLGVPIRLKEMHIVNLPSLANALLKVAISAMGEKMQKRLFLHSSFPDFLEKYDNYKQIFPKEYGGTIPLDDMISEFKIKMKKYSDAIADKDNQDIEIIKGPEQKKEELVGSFRKLEID